MPTRFNEFGFKAKRLPFVFLFDATNPQTAEAYRVGHLYSKRNFVTISLEGELAGSSIVVQGSFKNDPTGITDNDWQDLAVMTSPGVINIPERCFWMRIALTDNNGNVVPGDPCGPIRLDPINASTTTVNASTTLYNASNADQNPTWLDLCTGVITTSPPTGTGATLLATVRLN